MNIFDKFCHWCRLWATNHKPHYCKNCFEECALDECRDCLWRGLGSYETMLDRDTQMVHY